MCKGKWGYSYISSSCFTTPGFCSALCYLKHSLHMIMPGRNFNHETLLISSCHLCCCKKSSKETPHFSQKCQWNGQVDYLQPVSANTVQIWSSIQPTVCHYCLLLDILFFTIPSLLRYHICFCHWLYEIQPW